MNLTSSLSPTMPGGETRPGLPVSVSDQTPKIPTPAPSVSRDVDTQDFLRVRSNAQLDQQERSTAEQEASMTGADPIRLRLAGHIRQCYQRAEDAKTWQTEKMLDALRRRAGEYDASKLAEIQEVGGSEIWMKLTESKCQDVEDWLSDILTPTEGLPTEIGPTPVSKMPEESMGDAMVQVQKALMAEGPAADSDTLTQIANRVRDEMMTELQKEASVRADRMSTQIKDQFTEGGFSDALEETISDLATVGTGIIKGPCIEYERALEWKPGWEPSVERRHRMKFYRVDPFDFFPSPDADDVENAAYVCERVKWMRVHLVDLKDVDGYNAAEIDKCLTNNPDGVSVPQKEDSERRALANRPDNQENPDEVLNGIEYTGLAQGSMLREWGLQDVDDLGEYEINAVLIDEFVVYAILNPTPSGQRRYGKSVFKRRKGSFWGEGIPHLMRDIQDICNGVARNLLNNIAFGSGPQTVINDIESIAEGQDLTSIVPWNVWQGGANIGGGKLIDFYQPTLYASELMDVYEKFLSQADDRTVPRYAHGSGDGGHDTATGLSMMMTNASRNIKGVIKSLDRQIIRHMIEMVYVWNLIHLEDDSIKGDIVVKATGILGLFVKEQRQLRLSEAMDKLASPEDRALTGDRGRAVLIRSYMSDLDVPVDDVIPSDTELAQREQSQAQAQAAAGAAGQAGDRDTSVQEEGALAMS
jgi:hypothetical protein